MTEPGDIVLPGIDDDTNERLNDLRRRLDRKTPRNQLRATYYDCHRLLRQVSPVMPPHYKNLGLVLGWSAKAVDLLARRCNLETFTWSGGDLAGAGFEEIWTGNALGSEVDQGIVSSLIHATAFVINTQGVEGEPPALIHFKSALDATGHWNRRRRHLDDLLSITDRDEKGEPTGVALYLDGVTITGVKEDGKWFLVDVAEHNFGVPAEVLPYRPRLNREFGSSRISRPVMALQDEAVRAILRGVGHMDVYAYPEFWMLGADEGIFKNSDGSMKAAWQVMLGRIKGLPDDEDASNPRADVKQFPAASPTPHREWLNTISKMFARETALPDNAVAITDFANPTSADSYDASQYELIAEAEGADDDWTPGLRRAMARALAMANNTSPEAFAALEPTWRNPRFQSRAAQADAGMKQLAAMPWLAETEVGLELLGLTPQQRQRALAERSRVRGGSVLQALASAAASAPVSPAVVTPTPPVASSDAGN